MHARAMQVFLLLITLGLPAAATAGQWQTTELGPTREAYGEYRFGVNAAGQVAWSTLVGGPLRAAAYDPAAGGSADLHALVTAPALSPAGWLVSYAQDLNETGHAVGYVADTGRETNRRAQLWPRVAGQWRQALNLHAAVEATLGPQQQTAAYGISDLTQGGEFYVAGYTRRQVSAGSWSQPVLWAVDNLAMGVNQVFELGTGPFDYGIAYGVTEDGIVVGGVGVASGPVSYMTAAWWDLNIDDDGDGRPDVQLIPGVEVPLMATSVVNRVRRFRDGLSAVTLAVGTAYDPGGVLQAFVHEVGPGATTDLGFVLPSGANALAMDVSLTKIGTRDAVLVVGASDVLAQTLPAQPFAPHATSGVAQRRPLDPAPLLARVFDVVDGLAATATPLRSINAAAGDRYLVGFGGGRASLLRRLDTTPLLASQGVVVRRTATHNYWFLRSTQPGSGQVLLSNTTGGSPLLTCDSGAWDLANANDGASSASLVSLNPEGAAARTPIVNGAAPSTTWPLFQIVQGPANACALSPVHETATLETINPPGIDPVGDWRDCVAGGGLNAGAESDILTSHDHCGGCNQPATTSCFVGQCVNGSPVVTTTILNDQYEPNNTLAQGAANADVGTLSACAPARAIDVFARLPAGDVDFFRVLANRPPGCNQNVRVQLADIPAGDSFEMYLYAFCADGSSGGTLSCTGAQGNAGGRDACRMGRGNSGQPLSGTVWRNGCGPAGVHVYVEVDRFSGGQPANSCDFYRVSFGGP